VVRNGIEFSCQEGLFDNLFLSYVYEVRSGDTCSAGSRVPLNCDHLCQRSFYHALLLDMHGCLHAPIANWFPLFLNLLHRAENSPDSWSQSGIDMWKQSNMPQIVREVPIATVSGKILPFFFSKPKNVSRVAPTLRDKRKLQRSNSC
jgi:hypothetical protein